MGHQILDERKIAPLTPAFTISEKTGYRGVWGNDINIREINNTEFVSLSYLFSFMFYTDIMMLNFVIPKLFNKLKYLLATNYL
jgi:hypothetical protein